MVFVRYPALLKRLIANILKIPLERIKDFEIINPEIPPDFTGDKFIRLDINMTVNGQRVTLEVQVSARKGFTDRALYYWARGFSSLLVEGGEYRDLPRNIFISIVAFRMFKCAEFHSEYHALEITRHTPLSDKFCIHFFELPKLPEISGGSGELELWLALFNTETEEEMRRIEKMEVPVISQAIEAYRQVSASDEFRELERMRFKARHDEASALGEARREEREKWQSIVADKDAALADKDAALADMGAALADKNAQINELLTLLVTNK
jgi:predicted transposase/invertase (TIGR01784 family)